MRKIPLKCRNCGQPLEEVISKHDVTYYSHDDVFDCLKALIRRVEDLENELLAKKLPDGLSRSSEPGPPSSTPTPVVIPEYPKIK